MRENPFDRIVDKTMARVERVSNKIGRDFKNMKPFDKEPVSDEDMLASYDMLTPEDMGSLIQYHGEEALNEFIGEMEMKKRGSYYG